MQFSKNKIYIYKQQTLSSTQHKMIFIDRDINDNWKRRLDQLLVLELTWTHTKINNTYLKIKRMQTR